MDEATREIVAVDLTPSGVHDSPHPPVVLKQVAWRIGQVSADRAYDTGSCYEAIMERGAAVTIPHPRPSLG